MKKCKECNEEIKGRQDKQFCNDVCRANYHTNMRRFKKKKLETKIMIEKANIQVSKEVEDLYKKIFGG